MAVDESRVEGENESEVGRVGSEDESTLSADCGRSRGVGEGLREGDLGGTGEGCLDRASDGTGEG